jgi:uncharacterized protein (DUF885 family)
MRSALQYGLVSLWAALVITPSPSHAAQTDADKRFEGIYSNEWAWRQAELGPIDETRGEGAANTYLPHVDPDSQSRRLVHWRAVIASLSQIDPTALSPAQQVNFEIYRLQVQNLINDQVLRTYEMPFSSNKSFWAELLPSYSGRWRGAAEYKSYIGRMRDIPRYFDDEIHNMRVGLARGFTVPRPSLVGRDQSIADIADQTDPQANLYYAPFKSMPASIPAEEREALRREAISAIGQSVIPAHVKLLAFMRTEYLPKARLTLAAEALPDGAAFYRQMIREFTTTDLTPDQIHGIGLEQVARIHTDMITAMKATGYAGKLPDFLQYLRTDPKFYAQTPEAYLGASALIAKRGDAKLPAYFGLLPRGRFTITPVPANIAPFYLPGHGSAHVFLLNTYDLAHRPLYELTALTLHEGELGHGLQFSLAEEQPEQPAFRRYSVISAYTEGWAFYTETLGKEMGLYATPYDDFGRLSWEMWRACRLVVDTGIHHSGWTRQQAIDYLAANTSLPLHEINTEVDRYITQPGQALSYAIGMLDIERLRAKSEAALGPKFDIRAFHDTVLSMGSVPLPVLDARMDAFIASGGVDPVAELKK